MSFKGAPLSSDYLDWMTPQDFYEKLNHEFHFNLDPAATDESAKCEKYYTPNDDALSLSWGGCTSFCNPPYGRELSKWVQKAYEESQKPNTTIVMLIPARTDTSYWHNYIFDKASEVRFVRGRLKFANSDGTSVMGAPFPSAVVIFKYGEEDTRYTTM